MKIIGLTFNIRVHVQLISAYVCVRTHAAHAVKGQVMLIRSEIKLD